MSNNKIQAIYLDPLARFVSFHRLNREGASSAERYPTKTYQKVSEDRLSRLCHVILQASSRGLTRSIVLDPGLSGSFSLWMATEYSEPEKGEPCAKSTEEA